MVHSLLFTLLTFIVVVDAAKTISSLASSTLAVNSDGNSSTPLVATATATSANVPTPTDWKAQASTTKAAEECTKYYYAPVAALVSSFPAVWQIATIPAADTTAQEYFNAMNSSIPRLAVKGTPTGDFSTFTPTYDKSDPDCWWTFNKCVTPKLPGLTADISTCPTRHTWGYTFDDGPNCSHNAFYDFLQSKNQTATLFYIGSNIIDWPLEAQRGLAEGHEICAHTWSHRYMTALTNEEAFAELYYSKLIIHNVLGVTVKCWRPPFGDVDDRIRYIAKQLGMETIIWDNDTDDFAVATIGVASVEHNYEEILHDATTSNNKTNNSSGGGTIVLSHELNNDTMSLAKKNYPLIKKKFKHIVPVGVCQNKTSPYEETDYKYPSFEEYISGTTLIASNPTPSVNTGPMSVPIAITATASASASESATSSSDGNTKDKNSWAISGRILTPTIEISTLFFPSCIAFLFSF